MKKFNYILVLFLFFSMLYSGEPENIVVIYKNQGFITEKKKVETKKGDNIFYFFNNDSGILKNTIFITSEKNDIKNLSYKFVENYVSEEITGKKVRVYMEARVIEGEVLSSLDDLVLKTNNMIYKINRTKISYIEYPSDDFISLTPGNLIIQFESKERKENIINLNYFTNSLSWFSNYNFIFNEDKNTLKMDLNINVQNNGNKSYKNSKIYVVAGDVKTDVVRPIYNRYSLKAAKAQSDETENVQQQKLSDFYEYDIKGIYDIGARQNITTYILKNNNLNFLKEYVYDSAVDNEGVNAKFTIDNIKENNLGLPLPGGEASLFIEKNGVLHFIGKDMVKDTPEKEKIELKTGRVFDVKAERKHLFSEKIANNIWEEKYGITFKNFKDIGIKIKVLEKIDSPYWEINECNFNYKKTDKQTIQIDIDVEPQKQTEILYKVRKRY
ncbi:MAG: hypothetical protein KA120_00580 [Candidatus Goldbacteria bacterium]|nr:hypothetical protein [Candidatus Goldiibacteriota bacterium]